MTRPKVVHMVLFVIVLLLAFVTLGTEASAQVADDPHVRMPGTQPGQVSLEASGRCLNCHAGYNEAVEPGFNWQGSMMAQASRDFLFWSAMTVAGQDSVYAIGTPNAMDLCERCHFPKGWLEGRSDPPNASVMIGADYDGVQCDLCHRMWDPHFEETYTGLRDSDDWLQYWDETNLSDTPSQPQADATYQEDSLLAAAIRFFNGQPFFGQDNKPVATGYTEATSGQYFVSPNAQKRASFADAGARHQALYSRFHKSKYMCATCHDVSNPALANLGASETEPLPSETDAAYSYFHVERTFSEFMLSDYGQEGGAPGIGPFAPDLFNTSNPGNSIDMCQDCHMRDVVGVGANKKGIPIRPNDSVEHPNSGQPLHDLTGGNAWVSYVLASAVPGSPNYDAINSQLLNQGPAILTLDFAQGEGINPEALLAGVQRAQEQLQLAASIEGLTYNSGSGQLSFRIQNQTGHKLTSGFPEGRRIFVNVRAYHDDVLIYEVNPYSDAVGTLKGLPTAPGSPNLGANEIYVDELVYEMHPSSTLTGETETFRSVLADGRYKDNRIPAKGFRIGEAAERIVVPVWHGVEVPELYSAEEYAGGYDDVSLNIAADAEFVEVNLYYQTTTREYVEFLRNEINGSGDLVLPSESYIIQTDPFFAQLRAWGDTLWQLWEGNKDVPGAAPFLMTQASVGIPGDNTCEPPVPTLVSAVPAQQQVTVSWSGAQDAALSFEGYSLYYDQADKSQLVASTIAEQSYVDSGLTNGQEYCYKVAALYTDCVSGFSNVICAVPNNVGQADLSADALEIGYYRTSGKGKSQTTVYVAGSDLAQGDEAVFRATVVDVSTGLAVEGAVVQWEVIGPESVELAPTFSGSNGVAEALWKTSAPNKRGQGGTTPGTYTLVVTSLAAAGYTWDGAELQAEFTVAAQASAAERDAGQTHDRWLIFLPTVGN